MNVPLINGLRAIAILGVVWHHVFGPQFLPGRNPLSIGSLVLPGNPLASNGWLGVNLFFFLSGFVLFLPYATGQRKFASTQDIHTFWEHRARRLLPQAWIVLPLGLVLLLTSAVLCDAWYVHELPIWTQAVTYSVLNCGAFLVTCGLLARGGWLARLFELRALQLIGMMCFSIYVWHGILLLRVFPDGTTEQPLQNLLPYIPVYVGLVLVISALTYRYVEFPNRDIRALFLLERRRAPETVPASQ